jgi:hypothetical protein
MYISSKLRMFIREVNGALSTLDEPGKCHGGVKFHRELKLCERALGEFDCYSAALVISADRYGDTLRNYGEVYPWYTSMQLSYLSGVLDGIPPGTKAQREAAMNQLSFIRMNFSPIITDQVAYTAKMNALEAA